jgi:GTPase
MFVDTAKIHVTGGRGGNGCCSFRREKYVPLGGPDGGDGGNGGDIILLADNDTDSLVAYKFAPLLRADKGANGKGKNMAGRGGISKIAKVPVGTIIKDIETDEILADLSKHGQKFIAAKGGKGGRGNTAFKSNTNRAPRQCEEGEAGEERELFLELKLIADIGLVGFPNAGKSSLITEICNVRPKIASYPFTTLAPNLGVLILDDKDKYIKVADMPGLIEGAHENRGLGIQFLRHIERTKILLFMLDIAGVDGRDPLEDFKVLKNELDEYNPELMKKPYLVACNKMDLEKAQENFDVFRKKARVRKELIFPISCATKEGLDVLVKALSKLYDTIENKTDTNQRKQAE